MLTPEQRKEIKRDNSKLTAMDGIENDLGVRSKRKWNSKSTKIETPGEREMQRILDNLERLTGFVPPEKK